MHKIKLLPEYDLIKTGPVDHAEWNYKSILGFIQLKRFELCLKLLKNKKGEKLLEIGYGSGIFYPTLADFANEIYGLDIHDRNNEVEKILNKHNIKACLSSGNAVNIPFENNFFDVIISISAIEFIDELEKACLEIKRVLKKDGIFIVITPGVSPLLDFGLKILTMQSAKKDYEDRRKFIIPTLLNNFTLADRINFPRLSIKSFRLYNGLKLTKK